MTHPRDPAGCQPSRRRHDRPRLAGTSRAGTSRASLLGLACAALLLALTSSPATASARAFGYHEHDGFYLRLAFGAARFQMARETSVSGSLVALAYDKQTSSIPGWASFAELSVGATPVRGVAVVATVLAHALPNATLQLTHGALPLDSTLGFAFVGVGVDAFPNTEGGLHLGTCLGLASASAQTPVDVHVEALGGTGPAATLGLGYDWWVADQWSFGLLTRLTVASIHGTEQGSGGKATESDTVTVLGLMLTALLH